MVIQSTCYDQGRAVPIIYWMCGSIGREEMPFPTSCPSLPETGGGAVFGVTGEWGLFFLSLISCSNLENGGPCVSSGQHSRTSPNDVGVGAWLWKCESRRKPHPLLNSARGNQPWWSWRAHPGCEDKGELVGGWGNKTCSFQAQNQGYDLSQPNIYSIYELLKYLKAPNLQTQSCRITTMQANNRISKMTLSESPALLL